MRAVAARWTILELLHPIPSVLTTVAAVAVAVLFGIRLGDSRLWWIAAIMLLAQFSISALNEWADADLDAKSGRRRPVALGLLSRRTAAMVAVATGAAALIANWLAGFSVISAWIVLAGLGCGWAYDLGLKRTWLSFLPFALAFPLMPAWIGIIAGRPGSTLALLFVGGIPLATAIHLADAIPDREHDQAAGVATLAVALGSPRAEIVATGLLLVGSIVGITALLRLRGSPRDSVWLLVVPFSYVLLALASRNAPQRRAPLVAKWTLVGAAMLSAVPLVFSVSGR